MCARSKDVLVRFEVSLARSPTPVRPTPSRMQPLPRRLRLRRVEQLDQIVLPQIAEYDLPVFGLYLLAAPSTPEQAQQQVIERTESSERLSVGDVKKLIEIFLIAPGTLRAV
jgi:hypothetical protein